MFIRPEDDIRRTRFTVAVDFDGVIHRRTTKSNILALDEPMPGAATALKMLRQEGVWIIIHTARPLAEGDNLRELIHWLDKHGISYDAIWLAVGKPIADMYIDDRAYSFTGWTSAYMAILDAVSTFKETMQPPAKAVIGHIIEDDEIKQAFTTLLKYIGEDPDRPGLRDTPERMRKAWLEWTQGYSVSIKELFKTFDDGAEKADEMVIVKDIPFQSHCEHHLALFHGRAHIGYIPNGRILGLSKFARVVDAFSQRLQVQERLTNQVADAFVEHLQPIGVGVVIQARHTCMECRGVRKHGATTITSAVRGSLRNSEAARSEFLSLVRS